MGAFVGLARERFSLRSAAELAVILGIVALIFDISIGSYLSILGVIAAIRLGYVFADSRGFNRDIVSLGYMLLGTVVMAVIIAFESAGIAYYALLCIGGVSSVLLARAVFGGAGADS
ncbi:hypothetical protein [Halostagnicola sp. A-GB9-2]|uniref:hypothetical protein n=1 Tax=Halostagnicola sp. A-GB9-2 TaxID=3048066 RepID=UPI0024BFC533|nr:hypothetical protein [Halostagnicola sp. A-GB9-2]MDJ1433531.1 hypothetical protein [Halostagnicola sp. A-GB9-2]